MLRLCFDCPTDRMLGRGAGLPPATQRSASTAHIIGSDRCNGDSRSFRLLYYG